VYVCENNLYNEYTHYRETTAGDVLARPRAFGIPAEDVDGQDVRAVLAAARRAVARARRGEGPSFLLCNTYRYFGHHVGDVDRSSYRSKDEEEAWKTHRDPLKILREWMVGAGLARLEDFQAAEEAAREEVAQGVAYALAAPYPDPREVTLHVYA
jgi:pyruvate dehydrogenase E1 component alpha subunit